MKKLLILTMVLIIPFTSITFMGCWENHHVSGADIIAWLAFGYEPGGDVSQGKYGIAVGNNGVIYRVNGDTNIIFEQKISGTTERFNCVRVSSSTSNGFVFAVGNNGAIVRSTNTGNDWSVSAPVTSSGLYGIDFRSGGYCYAVGDNGTFLVSATNGDNWSQVPGGTTRNLKAIGISALSALNVVAVGEKGTIIRSTNSGINWTNVSIADTTINFYDISKRGFYYYTGNTFCIVGTGGRIYKSTDNGATWQQKPSGTTNTLRSIYQHTVDSIVVVGDNGTIRFSSNGGESWYTDAFFNSPSTRQYKAVSLVSIDHKTFSALSDTIWFVSNDPVTLGLSQLSSEVPNKFSLLQNYPNPFNPNTKIKFQIPIAPLSFGEGPGVRLIIYDILGREVETLVNGQLKPGIYEVDWNAVNYSSGIYFYKLVSEDFTETRKMVFIK